MRANEFITEKWSQKYKKSINCSNPKGFSQKAHCAGRKKHNENADPEAVQAIKGQQGVTEGETSGLQPDGKYYNKAGRLIGTWNGRTLTIDPAANKYWTDEFGEEEAKNIAMKFQHQLQKDHAPSEDSIKYYANELEKYDLQANLPRQSRQHYYDLAVQMLSGQKGVAEDKELAEEFDLIESIIKNLAEKNQVDSEVIWEDLESLTDDELYAFAVTTPIMEDWQKVNKKDKTDGMSKKAVNAYRREHPGSKLKTAVTTKPSKLKRGSKASKRRSSYCSRSAGQKKMHHIDCSKNPDKAICKARRRWNC